MSLSPLMGLFWGSLSPSLCILKPILCLHSFLSSPWVQILSLIPSLLDGSYQNTYTSELLWAYGHLHQRVEMAWKLVNLFRL